MEVVEASEILQYILVQLHDMCLSPLKKVGLKKVGP